MHKREPETVYHLAVHTYLEHSVSMAKEKWALLIWPTEDYHLSQAARLDTILRLLTTDFCIVWCTKGLAMVPQT